MNTVALLVRNLASVSTFERAANATLHAALDLAEAALGQSPFARNGRIFRALVQLHPDDGDERLIALEAGAAPRRGGHIRGGPDLPSATAWRSLATHHAPVTVDGTSQLVSLLRVGELDTAPSHGESREARSQRRKSAGRDATHLLAVPLPAPGGLVDGMIVIEATCREPAFPPSVWQACAPALETLAAVASPFLARLPVSESTPERPPSHEEQPGSRRVFQLLEQAADAFVTEAERAAGQGKKLDMDHAESFKGLVIQSAKRRFGTDERVALRNAFILLGKEATVDSRNHLAVYRREMEKVELARRELGHAAAAGDKAT